MSNTNLSGEHRDAFPSLNDSEYHEMLRTDEAVAVLSVYLEQRVAGLFDGHDPGVQRQYEHNPNFPFPIGPTAYEIAELVVNTLRPKGRSFW